MKIAEDIFFLYTHFLSAVPYGIDIEYEEGFTIVIFKHIFDDHEKTKKIIPIYTGV